MKKVLFSISMAWLATQLCFAQTYTVETVAGVAGARAYTNGPIADARFGNVRDVLVDASGNLIVNDVFYNSIRKIESGVVSTLAGDGSTTAGTFNNPFSSAFDKDGNIIVVQRGGNKISKVTPSGVISTIAGTGVAGFNDDINDPLQAQFNNCIAIAIDSENNIFITDYSNRKIRKITYDDGSNSWTGVSTIADVNTLMADGVTALGATFAPIGIAVDGSDNLYFWDRNTIKRMTKVGEISTIVGNGINASSDGTSGQPLTASIGQVYGICFDNEGNLILSDITYHRIKKVTPGTGGDWATAIVSTIAGKGTAGSDNGVGTAAAFSSPTGITSDGNGIIYVADANNYTIRKLTSSTLPVRFGTFNAQIQNNTVKLQWQTISEYNNSHFEILRSANGNNFTVLDVVSGNGNSNSVLNYAYTDGQPLSGQSYYQLKQYDKDGKSLLSEIVSVNFSVDGKKSLNAYYQHNKLQVNTTLKSSDVTKIRVSDIEGKTLKIMNVEQNGEKYFATEIPLFLKKGVYIITLNSLAGDLAVKFITE